ncbi:MAG: hypothetical protein C5B50_02555 [Verrucomicrobia bacterium]|nr:MAG: hypothetical protein C5B50_02555 [Verrucomicrobiota bacterium]
MRGSTVGATLTLLLLSLIAQLDVCRASESVSDKPFITLNTSRDFPHITSRQQWQARAREIREQILVSCGLWPMPDKTPLNPHIFGKIEHDDYSVERVYFEPLPGFYLAGNLYRPRGKGPGPFPGILNPHGHWAQGRLADAKDGSVVARCINFAKQGTVAFAYDMVGFNDSHFSDSPTNKPFYDIHRQFGSAHSDLLWNISLMGLQTWNSIRALDFLESLPDVDPIHLACTGASGGGTQTYILGAIVNRLAAQAPVCMVSHTMQGGCSCENAPGLRVEYSNMEIAAAAAPRPQILVAATGDWTKDTLTVEGPAIAHIYDLLNAPEKLRYVRFDFGHNYNQTSREAVYAWFDKWLLNNPAPQSSAGVPPAPCLKESPYQKDSDSNLRVFPDFKLPGDAVTLNELVESLKAMHRNQWRALAPHSKAGLAHFKEVMLPAWRHTLHVEWPETNSSDRSDQHFAGASELLMPNHPRSLRTLVIVVHSGTNNSESASRFPTLIAGLAHARIPFMALDPWQVHRPRDQFADFFSTYNRTEAQEQVRHIVAACTYGRKALKAKKIVLCGIRRAGLWALLAASAADAVVADCCQLDVSDEQALLAPDLFFPGIHNIGGFEGAAILAAPHPLLLHNAGQHFKTDSLRATYQAIGLSGKLRIEAKLVEEDLGEWILSL